MTQSGTGLQAINFSFFFSYFIFYSCMEFAQVTAIDRQRGYKARLMLSAALPFNYWSALVSNGIFLSFFLFFTQQIEPIF